MQRLKFECPERHVPVDVGIESELGTLLRIRMEKVRAYCPACGKTHEWAVGDAQLESAA